MNLKDILNKLNFLDYSGRISISNITVALFVAICAFRMTFGGSIMHLGSFIYNIQSIDTSDTLPVLFSLMNYSHKRSIINNLEQKKEGS